MPDLVVLQNEILYALDSVLPKKRQKKLEAKAVCLLFCKELVFARTVEKKSAF